MKMQTIIDWMKQNEIPVVHWNQDAEELVIWFGPEFYHSLCVREFMDSDFRKEFAALEKKLVKEKPVSFEVNLIDNEPDKITYIQRRLEGFV